MSRYCYKYVSKLLLLSDWSICSAVGRLTDQYKRMVVHTRRLNEMLENVLLSIRRGMIEKNTHKKVK